jgi:hypothetical protein
MVLRSKLALKYLEKSNYLGIETNSEQSILGLWVGPEVIVLLALMK